MQEKKRYLHKTIHTETAQEFDKQINELMDGPGDVIEFKTHDVVPFLAYIKFAYYELVPETLADEYELRGEGKTCGDCPYLEKEKAHNRNQKILPCRFSKFGKTSSTSKACDKFYEDLEAEF